MSDGPGSSLRAPLARIVERLLAEERAAISLDALGDALGDLFVTPDEIDAMVGALEAAGRQVGDEDEDAGRGIERLRGVLDAARALRAELGRSPTTVELIERTGLSPFAVQHALGLAKVMQR